MKLITYRQFFSSFFFTDHENLRINMLDHLINKIRFTHIQRHYTGEEDGKKVIIHNKKNVERENNNLE